MPGPAIVGPLCFVAADCTKQVQADVYKTLEELVPLQVNVQAVASREVCFSLFIV